MATCIADIERTVATAAAPAILALLAQDRQLYPTQIIGRLRHARPDLEPGDVHDALRHLFVERQVARLWHRYLLPGDIAAVRSEWLATLSRQERGLRTAAADPHACARTRRRLRGWDGWHLPEC